MFASTAKTLMIVVPTKVSSNIDMLVEKDRYEVLPAPYGNIIKQLIETIDEHQRPSKFNVQIGTKVWPKTPNESAPHIKGTYFTEEQKQSNKNWQTEKYVNPSGGSIVVYSKVIMQGWAGVILGSPSVTGNCSHLNLPMISKFVFNAYTAYYTNASMVHSTLPRENDMEVDYLIINFLEGTPELKFSKFQFD